MAVNRRQYGSVKPLPGQQTKGAGYSSNRQDSDPKVKQEDPSPPVDVVNAFHKNASVDTRPEDIHHRIGPGPNQAASGQHRHNGSDSPLLLEGVVITGSRGGNSSVLSIIQALVRLGATDSTTA